MPRGDEFETQNVSILREQNVALLPYRSSAMRREHFGIFAEYFTTAINGLSNRTIVQDGYRRAFDACS
jgi:hypothetical protein